MEEEHSEAVRRWQIVVQEKEQALAAEFAETEHVYRTTEHDLKEQLDEKTQIIEVKALRCDMEHMLYKLKIVNLR